MPSGDSHRSLARALDILELCSLNGSGYTLTQLSQHLGIAKGSISPLLHTLLARGYLTLDDQDHHYRIGRMAFRIGNTYLEEASALREIYRLMHDIVSVCHETCHLGSLKTGMSITSKGGDPAAQPYRHGGGPQRGLLLNNRLSRSQGCQVMCLRIRLRWRQ